MLYFNSQAIILIISLLIEKGGGLPITAVLKNAFFIIVFFVLFIPSNTYANKVQVVTEYLEPYQIKNSDGSLGGFMTEVVNAVFEEANMQPSIKVLPWARAIQTARNEKNVMIYSIVKTPERSDKFYWIGAVPSEPLYLWGYKSKFPEPVKSLDQLKDYSVSTLRQSNVDNYLTEKGFNVEGMGKEYRLLKMLSSQRVALTVGSPSSIKLRAQRERVDFNKLQKVIQLEELNIDLSLAFSRQSDKALVDKFEQAYRKIEDSGKLTEIRQKWYHHD